MTSTKIVLLGESGVGKTSLMHTIAGHPCTEHTSTIGVSVCMAWHEYKTGSPEHRTELMELWDIGGAGAHRASSTVFLEGAAGAILVHDLSNKKSEENLGQWLTLLDGKPRQSGANSSLLAHVESCPIPILTVGCKMDLAAHRSPAAYDRISIDCRRPIPPGSTVSMGLAKFFDAAIDRTKAPQNDKRRKIIWG